MQKYYILSHNYDTKMRNYEMLSLIIDIYDINGHKFKIVIKSQIYDILNHNYKIDKKLKL